ncbi:MAG: nuclear transport factor 2 family protein [Proteobacteria bacterium]|nr:MAG: nuclear transport factor 2 family protein [Pseudomonadota bacterium]
MQNDPTETLIRRYFETFASADRNEAEKIIADDFTFTSPLDNHIDRKTYFERCWPLAGTFAGHDLKEVFTKGEECFVTYDASNKDGENFRNTELFRVRNGQIHSVEVFFGLPKNTKPKIPRQADYSPH